MAYSWDQRIERAHKLSREGSSVREVLELYIQVAEFQKIISQSLNGAENADLLSLLRFLPQLRELVKNVSSSPLLQAATAALGDNLELWSELLLRHWEQDSDVESSAHAFLACVLLQPYAQHVTEAMNISAAGTSSRQCPACGNPPQLSVLREFNSGARRYLLCSLCSTEWDFLRVLCPNCGEQHNEKLPVFTAEEFPQARIEGCDTCSSYIKCIDLSKVGYAVPQVDDLATLTLDLWAQEQGYVRQQPNMFLLPEA
jgi:FdhE protein